MKIRRLGYFALSIIFLGLAGQAGFGPGRCINLIQAEELEVSGGKITPVEPGREKKVREGNYGQAIYHPPSPQDAPSEIREDVMLGYSLILETQKYLDLYGGNKLNCANCHFEEGITEGGKNGGISLVGVVATYPAYSQRKEAVISLVTKVNDCFKRSLNGDPLPAEGREMTAILTYLQWIARDLPVYAHIPWLGLRPIESDHQPDPETGRQVFTRICAKCHGNEGQGQTAPPLWGSDSFNDGAKMHELSTLAAFAYDNMPRGNPGLSVEEALDAAAYVTGQPRPHFTGN
ncbi:MAG: c-type cytochrome [bacterium]